MNSTDKVLENVNRYLSLTRYKYSTQEKLSRLNILQNYYTLNNEVSSEEKVTLVTVETAEQLSKEFKLPLKVKGVFLTEGRPKKKYYTAEQLRMSADNPVNRKFPMQLDHRDAEVSSIIGMVDRIYYDNSIKGLRYEAHINDENMARNVWDGIISQVSATIFSTDKYDEKLGMLVATDLTFKELSLVQTGAESYNSIEPV